MKIDSKLPVNKNSSEQESLIHKAHGKKKYTPCFKGQFKSPLYSIIPCVIPL